MNRALLTALVLLTVLGCGASEETPSEPSASAPEPEEVPETTTESVEPASPDESVADEDDDWEPPPYDYEELAPAEHAQVCGHTAHRPSDYECREDSDCRICHDGSNCGVPVNLDELRRRGAACQQEDAAECEYAAVRCCEGRCRVVSH